MQRIQYACDPFMKVKLKVALNLNLKLVRCCQKTKVIFWCTDYRNGIKVCTLWTLGRISKYTGCLCFKKMLGL